MWVVSERRKRQSRRGTRGREGRGDFMHPLDVREEVNAESEKRGGELVKMWREYRQEQVG